MVFRRVDDCNVVSGLGSSKLGGVPGKSWADFEEVSASFQTFRGWNAPRPWPAQHPCIVCQDLVPSSPYRASERAKPRPRCSAGSRAQETMEAQMGGKFRTLLVLVSCGYSRPAALRVLSR